MRAGGTRGKSLILICLASVLCLAIPHGGGSSEMAESAVSADSLMSMVRFLSFDEAASELRSRFVFREEPLSLVADSLAARLERYTGGTALFHSFQIEGEPYAPDSLFTTSNITLRLEGDGSVEGAFYVTAHYDAIAKHDEGWIENWITHPAPGANDNASGVAALLEIARTVSASPLPFDIVFVLFSAEELGLLGSEDYVARMTEGEVEEVLGVLNLDMIGWIEYGASPGVLVVSNISSGWFADLTMDSFERTDPSLEKRLMKPGLDAYDHTSFWNRGMSAISFSEPFSEGNRVLYPYYHSAADTMGNVDFEQVERITSAVAALIADLAGEPAEASLIPSDLIFYRLGSVTTRRDFTIGDTVTVRVQPRNLGGEDPPEGAMMRLVVELENLQGRELLYDASHSVPPAYRANIVDIPIPLGARHAGGNLVRARITVNGMGDDPSDNMVEESFSASGGEEVLLDHHFQPNPIRSGFGEAIFCLDLAAETDLKIEIFNMEGELIGRGFLGERVGVPLEAGFSCFPCSDLLPEITELASGIYLYRIVLYRDDGSTSEHTGRFAVEK